MTFDPATITTHPRKSPAEIRAVDLSAVNPLAARIVDSDPLMSIYRAVEWDCLDDDGKVWVAAIIRETLACAAAGNAHIYNIGERTMAQVFNAAGLVNMSDMQAVLDAVERALAMVEEYRKALTQAESDFQLISLHGEMRPMWEDAKAGRDRCRATIDALGSSRSVAADAGGDE